MFYQNLDLIFCWSKHWWNVFKFFWCIPKLFTNNRIPIQAHLSNWCCEFSWTKMVNILRTPIFWNTLLTEASVTWKSYISIKDLDVIYHLLCLISEKTFCYTWLNFRFIKTLCTEMSNNAIKNPLIVLSSCLTKSKYVKVISDLYNSLKSAP